MIEFIIFVCGVTAGMLMVTPLTWKTNKLFTSAKEDYEAAKEIYTELTKSKVLESVEVIPIGDNDYYNVQVKAKSGPKLHLSFDSYPQAITCANNAAALLNIPVNIIKEPK